jgi:DNA polymerase-3 subunit beta
MPSNTSGALIAKVASKIYAKQSGISTVQFTTCQFDLDNALRTIAPAIGVRSSHPILDCCLITAANGTMSVTGFNLDLGITVTAPALVETAGTVALPYRLLAGLVSRMEADDAVTMCDGAITASGASYGLAAADADDYPAMPAVEAPGAELALSAGVRACMTCASSDASKQLLQGIHLANGHMEATDGHRLMRYAVDLPAGIDLVLPASTMRLLQDHIVTIAHAGGQAVITTDDNITIYSRILDGTYPDVAKLIPPTFEHTITLDRLRLTRALERVAIIADAHNSIVKVEAVGGTIAITAEADANNGKELLAADGTATGTWAFNVHYLLDGLKAFRSAESVTLSANGPTTPVVLTPMDDTDRTYLVMPVQIRE